MAGGSPPHREDGAGRRLGRRPVRPRNRPYLAAGAETCRNAASMMGGMTTRKIAITLPAAQVDAARRAVAEGRARSVSAYIAAAVDAQTERQGLRAYVDELIAEHGRPSAEDYAWADQQLARDKRRRVG